MVWLALAGWSEERSGLVQMSGGGLALAGWSEERSGLVQMSGGGLAGTGWLVRGKAGSSTNVWRWFGWHWLAGERKGRV